MSHDDDSETNELELEVTGFQMPANLIATEFGEVNVRRNVSKSKAAVCRVAFTIAMEPQGRFAEGWRTAIALDASASMKRAYGRKVEARVDPELLTDYIKQGRLRSYMEDGEPTRKIQREAFAEIQEKGYETNYTVNILQPLVQDFTAYLAGSLDRTGKTAVIYWGCGKGDEIEVLGEFDAASCKQLAIAGPATFRLGKTTNLLPAIAHFTNQDSLNQPKQAQRSIYIFLTDGRIDDLEQVKNYTKDLALEIAVGKRNYLKLILIGIGNDVDRYQLQELDDFDTGLDIDIWDYKIASEMTSLTQIFAEVVNENQIVAENGAIYDDAGNCVKSYPKGLPAKVDFVMPSDSSWFELEVGQQRIRQSVVLGTDTAANLAIAPLAQKKLFDFEIKAQENQKDSVLLAQEVEHNQVPMQSFWWRWLAALLIGAAFISTMIVFAILIKRADETKLQNQPVRSEIKEPEIKPKSTSINKFNIDLNTKSTNTKPTNSTNSTNSNSSEKPLNDQSATNSSNISTSQIPKATNNITNNIPEKVSVTRTNKLTSSSDLNNSVNTINQNSINQTKTSDRTPTTSTTNSTSISILPIANPDIDVTIFFPSDESQLMPPEKIKIDNFWAKVQGRKGIIQVSGHADKTGDYAYNLDLSQSRANEVVRLLRDRGLDNNYKITFEALSWLQPIRKKLNATDNAFNRRVVIQFKEQR
jgi:outer membrane protein OmpA-like peptidoglycan-associated protein